MRLANRNKLTNLRFWVYDVVHERAQLFEKYFNISFFKSRKGRREGEPFFSMIEVEDFRF